MFVFVIFALIAIVGGAVYLHYLLGHMSTMAVALDKPNVLPFTKGLTWLNVKLLGWKTIILGWIAAATQGISFMLTTDLSPWKDLPWTLVFEQKIANYITFACAMLVPLTHSVGIAKAAATPPADNGSGA